MTTNEVCDGPAVDVQASDPFEGVPAPLLAPLTKRGFTKLTDVQRVVLGADARLHDLRISSQTGSGKTVAIGFALADRLIASAAEAEFGGPAALIIAPTRELADQVRSELDWLFADVPGVNALSVTGGTSVLQERRKLARRPRILVGTPGRLLDHIRSRGVDLSSVEQLVLDEADQMLDMGFREDLDAILEALTARQRTHMVSATFPAEVLAFVDRFQASPFAIEGTAPGAANADIEHIACLCHPRDRYDALVNLMLMTEGQRTLVFVRTRQDTSTLAEKLADDGFAAMAISGDMAQPQRTRTLNAFRRGIVSTLVATDVAARGIDVPEITQVVHFDPPMDGGIYTHRSGRTGRAGQKGRSVILVPPTAQRRGQRLLNDAGVEVSWRDVPGPAQVQQVLDTREDARLTALLDAPAQIGEEDLAAALRLLEGREATTVVARLLAEARSAPACKPRDIETPRSRMAPRPDRQSRDGGRRPARASSYARFSINWGVRSGATAKRLLAHVCRRGGITGDQVGVIDVSARDTTFEVDSSVAGEFSARIRTPDNREPHLTIRPLDRGDRSGASRPRSKFVEARAR